MGFNSGFKGLINQKEGIINEFIGKIRKEQINK